MDDATSSAIQTPLLATKLVAPQPHAALISRARLLDQLDRGLRRRLTVISAPAGSGKTTLFAEWIARRPQQVAWLALDADDNDPIRFWRYICAALQSQRPEVATAAGKLLQPPQPVPLHTVLTQLINDLSALIEDVALVLDDYHMINSSVVHESLTYLLDHAPPHLHIYLASRADPPLPLPRLRVRGQLGVLRAADLHFTHDEALAFLNQSMGLTLSPADVSALEARTEGWIAGLHLAALSMQGQSNVQQFLASFTGSHRYVVDYLAEEIFQQQPLEMQRFLLETSILDRLTASLCDMVTQITDSVQRLERLERQVLIVPLDSQRNWYRYHELFSSFLRNQLRQHQFDLIPALHARASAWFVAHALPVEAVPHALASADWLVAADLIERVADPILLRGETATVQRWLDALPANVVHARVQLSLVQAYIFLVKEQYDQLAPWVAGAERLLADDDRADPRANEMQRWRGQIAALQGALANHSGELEQAVLIYQQALKLLPMTDQMVRSMVAHSLANAQRALGDVAGARATMAALEAEAEASTTIEGLTVQASLQQTRGHLRAAAHVFRQILQIDEATLADPRWMGVLDAAPIWMGSLLYEWNDLPGAERLFIQGIEQCRRHTNRDFQTYGQLAFAWVQHARGDVAQARSLRAQAWETLSQMVNNNAEPRSSTLEMPEQLHSALRRQLFANHARLALAQGDRAAAEHWAAQRDRDRGEAADAWQDAETLTLARVELAQGKPERALRRITALQRAAEADERWRTYLEALIIQVLIYDALDDRTAALHTLRQALTLAEPEGYLRSFVDQGQTIQVLLTTLRRSIISAEHEAALVEYIDDILEAFGATIPADHTLPRDHLARAPNQVAQLAEPLTEREMDVLACMAQGMSNAEIADTLIVAVSTVRTHIKNIYGKLAVRNRVEAISAARAHGLLE